VAQDVGGMSNKYGSAHRHLRAKWAAVVARGEAQCSELVCVKASRHINPDEEWHLAHTADGSDYLGPAHAVCNTSEGAIRGVRLESALEHIRKQVPQLSATDAQLAQAILTI